MGLDGCRGRELLADNSLQQASVEAEAVERRLRRLLGLRRGSDNIGVLGHIVFVELAFDHVGKLQWCLRSLTHLRRRYFLDSPDSSVLAFSHRPRTARVSTPPAAAFRVSSAAHLTARSVLRSAIRFDS